MLKAYRDLTAEQKIECYAHWRSLTGEKHKEVFESFADYDNTMNRVNYNFNPCTGECEEDQ